jgi:hypothetical protein
VPRPERDQAEYQIASRMIAAASAVALPPDDPVIAGAWLARYWHRPRCGANLHHSTLIEGALPVC